MKLSREQAIKLAKLIYGKSDERIKDIEYRYKVAQTNILDITGAFINSDAKWVSKASPDEIATFLSSLKKAYTNTSKDNKNLIRMAYSTDTLKTNGDLMMAKVTQQLVKTAMYQKVQISVGLENVPDAVSARTYHQALKVVKRISHPDRTKDIDTILQRSARNAVKSRNVDYDSYAQINKQTLNTIRRVREVAERAAKSNKDSLIWKQEVTNILTGGTKITNGQMGRAAGMIRTTTAQSINRTILDDFKKRKVKRYEFISLEAPNTCQECHDLDGKIFNVDDAEEGVNYPLIHYNCQCIPHEVNEDDDWDTSTHDITEEFNQL